MSNPTTPTFTLTPEQQVGADEIFNFLLSDEKEHRISGPGGVGKTYFMQYVIHELMPRYFDTCQIMGIKPLYESIEITATTNKAAEELYKATGLPAGTVYSFLGLTVTPDGKGGTTLRRGRKWRAVHNIVLFVDEAGMLDRDSVKEIRASTVNCKIIYVGDHCQLGPIKEEVSQVYLDSMGTTQFVQPQRNKGQPALIDLCLQTRTTVETNEFKPIQIVPGVIDLLDQNQLLQEINDKFSVQNLTDKIICYTNERVLDYNDHIRTLRGLPDLFTAGEVLVNNSAVQLKDGMIPVERLVVVLSARDLTRVIELAPDVRMEVQDLTIDFGRGAEEVSVPVNRNHFKELVKYFRNIGKSTGDWSTYYRLTETFPDLRQPDASTTHKAQGSSHDTVYIDLDDMSSCYNPKVFKRLFYVAVSRARKRVAFFGSLPEKYGGIIV